MAGEFSPMIGADSYLKAIEPYIRIENTPSFFHELVTNYIPDILAQVCL